MDSQFELILPIQPKNSQKNLRMFLLFPLGL